MHFIIIIIIIKVVYIFLAFQCKIHGTNQILTIAVI